MTLELPEIPRALRRGGKLEDTDRAAQDAVAIIDLVCRNLGLSNLDGLRILDMGCGYRLAKTILEQNLRVAEYVGIDVFKELIEFLQSNIHDPRFSFHAIDSHNAMYNPEGKALDRIGTLPAANGAFDILWLFSVFTHLAPHDYVTMLKLLRPHATPNGRLMFSLFINEVTPSGRGFISSVNTAFKQHAKSNEDDFSTAFAKGYQEDSIAPRPFLDFDPKQPLKWAVYSREHALQLIDGTGWEVESLNDPEEAIQHYMICRPV